MDNIIIEKVINNNIISAYEKSGAEVIVMGRGIGFKKKQGEMVPADQISKIFRIKSRTLAEQFKELLANMPLERVRISDEIISHAKDHLKLKLNQSIYVTLTDHINFAIERVSQGIEPQNALLWEIKRFYPQEFQLGIYALELIQDRLDILLPEDEAGFSRFYPFSGISGYSFHWNLRITSGVYRHPWHWFCTRSHIWNIHFCSW